MGDGGDDGWSGERRVEWSAWSGLVLVLMVGGSSSRRREE